MLISISRFGDVIGIVQGIRLSVLVSLCDVISDTPKPCDGYADLERVIMN